MEAATLGSATTTKATSVLLACGIVAGPLYVVVGLIEALTRKGFDPTRHDLSMLSNGDLGWIHSTLLVLTGLLTIACAVGMGQALQSGRGRTWGPLLVGLYGLGLIGAGIFAADPALGFPPGTPADARTVSWHGFLHFLTGGIGFLGLIGACFVFARRFSSLGHRGWAAYSMATGVGYSAAFLGIAMGSQQGGATLTVVVLAFTAAVLLGWAWVSAMAARLMTDLPHARG